MQENKIQTDIRLQCSNPTNRLFRNHVGTGYTQWSVNAALNKMYDIEVRKRAEKEIKKGFFSHGFGLGTSDIIGIQSITITPDMVGKKIGVFTAIEVKDPNHKTNPELLNKQNKFINIIR